MSRVHGDIGHRNRTSKTPRHAPFAFTHSAFRFGSAAWSLNCSRLSGGSVYTRLLERRRRASLASNGMVADETLRRWGRGSPAKLRREVRLRSMGDSLAVLVGRWEG